MFPEKNVVVNWINSKSIEEFSSNQDPAIHIKYVYLRTHITFMTITPQDDDGILHA